MHGLAQGYAEIAKAYWIMPRKQDQQKAAIKEIYICQGEWAREQPQCSWSHRKFGTHG